jgi:hypothetical protein
LVCVAGARELRITNSRTSTTRVSLIAAFKLDIGRPDDVVEK